MKPYKIALMAGTHQHRWPDDGSGICEKCGREHAPHSYDSRYPDVCRICGAVGKCPHNGEFNYDSADYHRCDICYTKFPHEKTAVGTEEICWRCEVCERNDSKHQFSNGICTFCGWECPHTIVNIENMRHKCQKCGILLDHSMTTITEGAPCEVCECGYSRHTGMLDLQTGCCTGCGTFLEHPDASSTLYGNSRYYGSYLYDSHSYAEENFLYTCYRRWTYDFQAKQWYPDDLYMFKLRFTTVPIQFGGDYAYKASGIVFRSVNTIPISPDLLTKYSVFNLKLAQYELDGTLKEASMEGTTSSSCTGILSKPEFTDYDWTP